MIVELLLVLSALPGRGKTIEFVNRQEVPRAVRIDVAGDDVEIYTEKDAAVIVPDARSSRRFYVRASRSANGRNVLPVDVPTTGGAYLVALENAALGQVSVKRGDRWMTAALVVNPHYRGAERRPEQEELAARVSEALRQQGIGSWFLHGDLTAEEILRELGTLRGDLRILVVAGHGSETALSLPDGQQLRWDTIFKTLPNDSGVSLFWFDACGSSGARHWQPNRSAVFSGTNTNTAYSHAGALLLPAQALFRSLSTADKENADGNAIPDGLVDWSELEDLWMDISAQRPLPCRASPCTKRAAPYTGYTARGIEMDELVFPLRQTSFSNPPRRLQQALDQFLFPAPLPVESGSVAQDWLALRSDRDGVALVGNFIESGAKFGLILLPPGAASRTLVLEDEAVSYTADLDPEHSGMMTVAWATGSWFRWARIDISGGSGRVVEQREIPLPNRGRTFGWVFGSQVCMGFAYDLQNLRATDVKDLAPALSRPLTQCPLEITPIDFSYAPPTEFKP
jgi:hypothetical protein